MVSSLNYACPIWSRACNTHLSDVSRKQRCCLRSLKLYSTVFKPLNYISSFSTLCLLYRILNSDCLIRAWIGNAQVEHSHYTRSVSDTSLYIPFHRLTSSLRSCLFHRLNLWNALPLEIRESKNICHFKKLLNEVM